MHSRALLTLLCLTGSACKGASKASSQFPAGKEQAARYTLPTHLACMSTVHRDDVLQGAHGLELIPLRLGRPCRVRVRRLASSRLAHGPLLALTSATVCAAGGCPVIGSAATATVNPSNQMPDESQAHEQPGRLQTKRQASSIPTGSCCSAVRSCVVLAAVMLMCADNLRRVAADASPLPGHQPGDTVVWQYPSEQMFYNAMKRKGWDAQEEDMPAIVAIHNGVNERAWHQVCKYEVRARSRR